MPLAKYGCLVLWGFVVWRKWSSEKSVFTEQLQGFVLCRSLGSLTCTEISTHLHNCTISIQICAYYCPSCFTHAYTHTHTHSFAESAQSAIFTSWALALCLHPNIAQMFQAFDVWRFYRLANTNISVIKTITEWDLQAILQTQGREIAGRVITLTRPVISCLSCRQSMCVCVCQTVYVSV